MGNINLKLLAEIQKNRTAAKMLIFSKILYITLSGSYKLRAQTESIKNITQIVEAIYYICMNFDLHMPISVYLAEKSSFGHFYNASNN